MQAHIGYKDKHPHFIYLYSLCGAANKWARELYLINCLLSVEELTLSPIRRSLQLGRYSKTTFRLFPFNRFAASQQQRSTAFHTSSSHTVIIFGMKLDFN